MESFCPIWFYCIVTKWPWCWCWAKNPFYSKKNPISFSSSAPIDYFDEDRFVFKQWSFLQQRWLFLQVCEICGKIFHHPDHLQLHLRYHQDILKVSSFCWWVVERMPCYLKAISANPARCWAFSLFFLFLLVLRFQWGATLLLLFY